MTLSTRARVLMSSNPFKRMAGCSQDDESTREAANRVLRGVFGHDSFRFGQLEAITAVMKGHDVVVRLTTRAGKSLYYQIPSQLRSGSISLIISTLSALMKEQVNRK